MHALTCPCGAVELTVRGTPLAQFHCHCDDCRKMTSGAYAAESVYGADDVEITRGGAAVWTLKRNPRDGRLVTRAPRCVDGASR